MDVTETATRGSRLLPSIGGQLFQLKDQEYELGVIEMRPVTNTPKKVAVLEKGASGHLL